MKSPLLVRRPSDAAKAVERVAGDHIAEFERVVEHALQGQLWAVRAYLKAWDGLLDDLLALAKDVRPDLVVESEGRLILTEVKTTSPPPPREVLEWAAIPAVFSPWVTRYGVGRGLALYALSEFRQLIPLLEPLPSPPVGPPKWNIDGDGFSQFARLASIELERHLPPLRRIAEVFDLNDTELAKLFGVRRQAVAQWLEGEIPKARLPKLYTLVSIADKLEDNLKRDRIPAVIRRRAREYGGLNMLEMIEQDRHEELLEKVRASFDWAATA